jgi:predicted GNAT family acetyltransferase
MKIDDVPHPGAAHAAPVEVADATAVQSYLRARARFGPKVGPFSILFSQGDRSIYGNYAIPDDMAKPTPAEIGELEEAFRVRKRIPRFEYVPTVTPDLETALLGAGYSVEMRPPLMTCRKGFSRSSAAPKGVELVFVEDEDRLLEAVSVEAQALAGDEEKSMWLTRIVGRGGRVLVAYESSTRRPVGAGALTPQIDGVREVVAIAVIPEFRRRGIAQAMTALLAEDAFAGGCDLTFLSAAGEAQSEIYARAGFERRDPMLFISKPEA